MTIMEDRTMKKSKLEKKIRWSAVGACELFCFISLCLTVPTKDVTNVALCIGTFALILIPEIVEKLFFCKINTVLYMIGVLYALGPLLGDIYRLYYLTSWWDKLLHTLGGVVFAMFGAYLFTKLTGKQDKIFACAIFALCFSVTLSVCWEFVEFGCDYLLGTDMQHDTVIQSIHSYHLGDTLGEVGKIDDIHSVTVNGQELNGYLDIGLYDSMTDMLLESAGALAFSLIFMLDKGKHPLFLTNDKK